MTPARVAETGRLGTLQTQEHPADRPPWRARPSSGGAARGLRPHAQQVAAGSTASGTATAHRVLARHSQSTQLRGECLPPRTRLPRKCPRHETQRRVLKGVHGPGHTAHRTRTPLSPSEWAPRDPHGSPRVGSSCGTSPTAADGGPHTLTILRGPARCGPSRPGTLSTVSTVSEVSVPHFHLPCTPRLVIRAVSTEGCSTSTQNVVQTRCSACSVALTVTATRSLSGVYRPH